MEVMLLTGSRRTPVVRSEVRREWKMRVESTHRRVYYHCW